MKKIVLSFGCAGFTALAALAADLAAFNGIWVIDTAEMNGQTMAASDVPVIEAMIPTLIDPSLTNDKRHLLSAVVQYAPVDLKGGWTADARKTLADRAVAVLESVAPGISGHIVARQLITPADLQSDWGATGGHAMHVNEGFDQFAQWRPLYGIGRYETPIDGLFLSGAGTSPGGGVTGAPGANAAEKLIRHLRRAAE
jgi:phytoene dehydrogenase-like protein